MIERFSFGCIDGEEVTGFRINSETGLTVCLMSYGARIVSLHTPDRHGALGDIVLGFDNLDAYVSSNAYHGAVCGRYGNRIADGRLMLDGQRWSLTRNDGVNHLHGGFVGFDRKNWRASIDEAAGSVTFRTTSPHREEGYPGTLDVSATYSLLGDVFALEFRATTDAPTVVSLINHCYWNLSAGRSPIGDHDLQIASSLYLPTDNAMIPTGEIATTRGTKFDFLAAKPVGRDMARPEPGKAGYRDDPANVGGYDATWVLGGDGTMRPAARVEHPGSGRGFELSTTEPSLQFYTASYLDDPVPGKHGQPYGRYAGLTLEPQMMPNAPNVRHFPSATLRPGEVYRSRQAMRFFVCP